MPRRRNRVGFVAVGVALVLVLIAGVGVAVAGTSSRPATDRYVTATVSKGSVTETLALSGTVTRTNTADARFGTSGTVTSVKVAVGQKVKAGQVLATLDKAPLSVALLQAKAGLARAQATLSADLDSQTAAEAAAAKAKAAAAKAKAAAAKAAAASQAAMKSMQTAMAAVQQALAAQQKACAPVLSPTATPTPADLAACTATMQALAGAQAKATAAIGAAMGASAGGGAAPTSSVSAGATVKGASNAQIATDRANVLAARQKVDSAEDDLAAATLRCPVDGVVGTVTLVKGASSSGRAITVVGSGKADLSIEVPLSVRPLVAVGQAATVTPPGSTDELTAKVTRVSMLATSGTSGSTATYTTTLRAADPAQVLRTGVKADVTIVLRTVSDVLTVPVSAITKVTSTTATVKVLDAGTTATPQTVTVTTGALGGGLVQIVEGLTEGQRVVLADRQQALPAGNVFGRRTSASASPVAGGAAPATAPGGSSSSTAAPTGEPSAPQPAQPSTSPSR